MDAVFEEVCRGILKLNLHLALDQWSQFATGRLRRVEVHKVDVGTIEEAPGRLIVAGSVTRWDRLSHRDASVIEPFRVVCPVPSLVKTPKSVRPMIVMGVADASAS